MSSSVFYKFKNSKEPERIVFDGTDISVFELKREIIIASGLGDGSDFDLHLYPQDQPTTEYDDDTTSISRSSTVIAVRRPAARGQGRAARYISGKPPVRAKKAEKPAATGAGGASAEQDAEAAFLAESAEVWNQQKETLANAQFVRRNKKPVNVPEHEPPSGYVCYRCNKKGHWIQLCPTNNDPDFKPTARAKRTTGIPRSFLKTVEKPADDEDARGIMLNADGEYVQVMTDTKAWEKFQEKTNAAKAQAANVDAANKEARERGLECPIDNRMFVDPVKTPCCNKTYCHDCIENKLADEDLVCPSCGKDNILIDDLATDEEMVQKVKDYEAEKAKEKLDKEQAAKEEAQAASAKPSSPSNNEEHVSVPPADEKTKAGVTETNQSGSKSPKPSNPSVSQSSSSSNVISPPTVAAAATAVNPARLSPGAGGSDTDTSTTSKKRKEAPTDIKPPTAPKAMRQQNAQGSAGPSSMEKDFLQQMEALKQMQEQKMPGAAAMPMPIGPGLQGNPMMGMAPNGMSGMNGMNGMHPMVAMNGGFPPHMNQWNGGYNNQGFQNGMGYGNNMHGGWNNGGYNNQHQMGGYNNGVPQHNHMMNGGGFQGGRGGGWGGNQGFQHGGGYLGHGTNGGMGGGNGFMNQQQPNQQDAYERKPLNPHRSQNKNRKQRAPDFHYVQQGHQG